MKPCKRMKVVAIGVKEETIEVAENGNYTEEGCKNIVGGCGCIHAEANLLKKMSNPDMVIVSHSPCLNCSKLLVEAGVKKVVYYLEYRIKDGIEYLKANGVEVSQLTY